MADSYTELTPAELDRIEDALEGLGDGSGEAPGDRPPKLRAHLDADREVLMLSREALPMVEVPDGLLDAVLAEARAAAPEPEPTRERAGAGLWERLRRSFVLPGFALAATAALLVVILRPDRSGVDDMSEGKAEAPAAAASDRAGDAPPPAAAPTAAAPAPTESGAKEGGEAAEAEEEATPASAVTVDAPTIREEKAKDASSGGGLARPAKPASMPTKKSKAAPFDDAFDAPAPAEAKKAEPIDQADKSSVRELLDKADKLRRRGRCDEASAVYRQLEGIGGTSEAQALVGLGLCAEFVGESNTAGSYFQRARKLAAVDGLIAAGRKQMEELGATKKKAKADFGE